MMFSRRTFVQSFAGLLALSAAGMQSISAEEHEEKKPMGKLVFEVEGRKFTATLADNAATRKLVTMLPLTLEFEDLYGREFCHRFAQALPTDDVQYRGYEIGEIVYWPPRHSFVILYEQNGEAFDMQSIGRIDSLKDLPSGNFTATLSLQK